LGKSLGFPEKGNVVEREGVREFGVILKRECGYEGMALTKFWVILKRGNVVMTGWH